MTYVEMFFPPEGGWVSLHDESNDHSVMIPIDKIHAAGVNWLRGGGAIELRAGSLIVECVFPDGDAGEECASALRELQRCLSNP